MPILRCLYCLLLMLALCGCPPREEAAPAAVKASIPSEPLPVQGRLLAYDKLKLGLDTVGIAQAYNAPEGQGDGFKRVVQDFDGVQHHFVKFDSKAGQPERLLVLAVLRDELYQIIDRREGLSTTQAAAWHTALIEQYGPPDSMPVEGAQFSWGPENGVLLTYTQDNSSETAMSANVVLVFKPYEAAAFGYLEDWQRAHPEYKAEELPF